MSYRNKTCITIGAVMLLILASCKSTPPESAAPTIPAGIAATPTAVSSTPILTNPPVIDGILSADEWQNAEIAALSDGGELLKMQDDDYLYLGIRSVTEEMIGANVFVAEGEQVRILHTSAALGTAVYQQNSSTWQQTQDFDWQCRDTSDSDAAQAERAAYLQGNGWLAANSRTGTPNELEYQIKLPEVSYRIAVSMFCSSAPNERVLWPPTLNDDTIQPNPGGLPTELHFLPEQWALVGGE